MVTISILVVLLLIAAYNMGVLMGLRRARKIGRAYREKSLTPEEQAELENKVKLLKKREELRSKCHNASVRVVGGVTKYHECTLCEEPCDIYAKKS